MIQFYTNNVPGGAKKYKVVMIEISFVEIAKESAGQHE